MITRAQEDEAKLFEEAKHYFSCNFNKGIVTRKDFVSRRRGNIGDVIGLSNIRGYVLFKFKTKNIYAHRFIFYCYFNFLPETIDHINGNKSDNRIINLRAATVAQNQQNKTRSSRNNKSGFLGVSPKKGKYRAQIQANGKIIYLGMFSDAKTAYEAYLKAKRINHEFCTI